MPEQLSQFVRFRNHPRKVPVSVRLDAKLVERLKSKGEGHLTRINDVLLNQMEGGVGGEEVVFWKEPRAKALIEGGCSGA